MWAMTYAMVNYLSTSPTVSASIALSLHCSISPLLSTPIQPEPFLKVTIESSHIRPRQKRENKKTTPLYNASLNYTPMIIALEHIPGASPGVKLIPWPIWCRPSGGSSSGQWSHEMGADGEHLALHRVSAFNAVVQNAMFSQRDRTGQRPANAQRH